MFISPVYLIIAGLVFLYLLSRVVKYKNKLSKPEVRYVDTSGITNNPPEFIDVVKNKTINFEVGKFAIKIEHLRLIDGMDRIRRIAGLFSLLQTEMHKEVKGRLNKFKQKGLKMAIYRVIVDEIYKLSKPFVKKKFRFKLELNKKAFDDFEWMLLVVEQILDYWTYVKKLVALLSRGGSLRQTVGGGFTWSSYETDSKGRTSIKPRYAMSLN